MAAVVSVKLVIKNAALAVHRRRMQPNGVSDTRSYLPPYGSGFAKRT